MHSKQPFIFHGLGRRRAEVKRGRSYRGRLQQPFSNYTTGILCMRSLVSPAVSAWWALKNCAGVTHDTPCIFFCPGRELTAVFSSELGLDCSSVPSSHPSSQSKDWQYFLWGSPPGAGADGRPTLPCPSVLID